MRTNAARPAAARVRVANPSGRSARSAVRAHLDGPLTVGNVLGLQRSAGNRAVTQLMIQRNATIAPAPQLTADRFRGSTKLEACFADRSRLREGDSDGDATARVQQALLDLPAKTGNTYDLGPTGADGHYGRKTAAAIRKFKADENLGFAQHGDVGPGTMRRLDQLFVADRPPKPKPKPPGPNREDNELLGALFHNRELEKLFDKIFIQHSKMMRQQGVALTEVQQDLSKTDKREAPIGQRMLLFAAEKVIEGAFGKAAEVALGETLKGIVSFAIEGIGAAGGEKLKKAVEATFDAAIDGGKDVIKKNIAPGGLETQPLAKFIDAQHNALIESNIRANEEFSERKNGAGSGDEGMRTFTDEDKVQILATAPAVVDPRLDRAQKYLDGVVDATAKAKNIEYTHAIRQWSVANAQQATDDNFNPGGEPATDGNALRGKSKTDVPGVLEVGIELDPANPKKPVVVTELSMSGLSDPAREKITKLQGEKSLGALGYVMRVTGERSGVKIEEVKTETHQIFQVGTNDAGGRYLEKKDDGSYPSGRRRLFKEEVEKQTIKQAGGIKGPR